MPRQGDPGDKKPAPKRYAMTMDPQLCVGCQACVLACKAENRVPVEGWRDWVVMETYGVFPNLTQQIRSERCGHCSAPPCVSACPTGASHVNEGGTVLVTRSKCTGCKACIAACPYDARYVHQEGFVDKCTFCLHRVLEGRLPACVEICPTTALAFGDLNDPTSNVRALLRRRKHRVLKPEAGLRPNLYILE
jgi:Fe-S-cluster-containing dehydrogenase component